MKRLLLIGLALVLVCACAAQKAYLIDLPEQTAAPTVPVSPTPTPDPEPLVIAPIEDAGFLTDSNGLPILDEQTHYFEYYLTLANFRLYEQNEETLIDATIQNSFQKTLTGSLRIIFTGEDGIQYGFGDFYTASGTLKLLPGETRVYCDVRTEVDVKDMNWELVVVSPFLPE